MNLLRRGEREVSREHDWARKGMDLLVVALELRRLVLAAGIAGERAVVESIGGAGSFAVERMVPVAAFVGLVGDTGSSGGQSGWVW
jgi:hypothetical protein